MRSAANAALLARQFSRKLPSNDSSYPTRLIWLQIVSDTDVYFPARKNRQSLNIWSSVFLVQRVK